MVAENSGRIRIDQIIQAVERSLSTGSRFDDGEDASTGRMAPENAVFDRWFGKGLDFMEDESLREAIEAFSRAIAISPDNPYIYAYRARCHWANGELDHAARDLLETLVRDPGDLESFVCLGEVLVQDERYDEGIRVLGSAIALQKNADPEIRRLIGERAHYSLAVAQLAVNDLDAAMNNALRAFFLAPKSPFTHDLCGRIRLARGDHEGALHDLDAAIAIEKNDPDLYLSRSRIHIAAGDDRRADADLQTALTLASVDADDAVALGIELMDLEDARRALESFTNAIRLDPDNGDAWYYRAYLKADEDPQSAYDDIEQALRLDPGMPWVHIARGYVLNSLGRVDEALSAFRHGVSLDPDDAVNQAVLGKALLERRRFHEALTCFELALKLDDGCDEAYLGRAMLFSNLGDHAGALADAQTVLENDAENVDALHIRAAALMTMGQLEEAVADFERALQFSDGNNRAESLANLALALIEKGSMAEASAMLDEAFGIDPDEIEIHYARAALEEKLGNYDGAARHIERALQADDSDDRYHEMRGEIMKRKGDAIAARDAFEKALQLALSRKDKKRLRERIAEL